MEEGYGSAVRAGRRREGVIGHSRGRERAVGGSRGGRGLPVVFGGGRWAVGRRWGGRELPVAVRDGGGLPVVGAGGGRSPARPVFTGFLCVGGNFHGLFIRGRHSVRVSGLSRPSIHRWQPVRGSSASPGGMWS